MLALKVVAKSINNLTDARYFAAYGVDWLGFDINPASTDYVNQADLEEIAQWVEGPGFLIQGAIWNEHYREIIDLPSMASAAVLVENPDEQSRYEGLQIFSSNPNIAADQYLFDSMLSWRAASIDASISFIQYDSDISLVKELLNMEDPPGLCLTGGKEEAVGMKAFDQLDEVFDILY